MHRCRLYDSLNHLSYPQDKSQSGNKVSKRKPGMVESAMEIIQNKGIKVSILMDCSPWIRLRSRHLIFRHFGEVSDLH
jgi:hypothetical protein